ncbi:reverse transcriptase domain-containing protein [Tanacetum coccineum]
MFNSTLTGNARVWFDDLPPESIDSYNDLREAFLKNYLQQKKCIRDPILLHNIKQRDGESTEDFIQRHKSESGNIKGAPECMRISGFVARFPSRDRSKPRNPRKEESSSGLETPGGGHRQNFKKRGGGFRSQHKTEKRQDRFILLTKTPKEILALEKGKFKTPPPMTTPVEKRNANKFCEFHEEVGHNTVRQKITQSFSPDLEISFPPLGNDEGAEGPLIIEAEVGGHQVHRMCIDGGSSFEILYEHCFNRLRPEIRNQMVPAITSLVGFSGEIKWPLGQITLLVKVGDDEHSTSAWMDFMVVRSTSPFNGIIGRPGLRKMKAVPSTTHGMIKFLVMRGILTLRSSKIIPIECAMVSGPEDQPPPMNKVKEERIKVAINPEHPEQTVMIGSDLTEKTRSKLCNLLQRSLDIFAWTPTDMTGVPRQIAEHKLNVRKGCPPVRQKKRGQAAERNIAINDEVSKLVTAGIRGRSLIMIGSQTGDGTPVQLIKASGQNIPRTDRSKPRGRRRIKPSITKMLERCAEVKWKIGKLKQEAEAAFKQMKEHIAKLPMLIAPEEQEELIVYLAASKEAGVLADFIVERPEEEGQDDSAREEEPLPARWTLFTDGSSCVDGCGAGVILTDPEGVEFTYALRFQFETTNNEAEYEALIAGLRIAEKMGVKNLEVNVDSKLVANQVNGTYIAKETDMVKYLENFAHLSKQVLVEELKEKSVNEKEVLAVVEEEGDTWMTPIHEYLTDETLPAERKKARAIKRPSQANYILREIHEVSCSMHAGTRSVVAKALRTNKMLLLADKCTRTHRTLIKACQECQVHKPVPRNPQEKLNPITSLWPFYKWGLHMGPRRSNHAEHKRTRGTHVTNVKLQNAQKTSTGQNGRKYDHGTLV